MMSASKGALHVPPVEMLEILIYLAENNRIYGEQARLTLAGWDETSCKEIAADPDTPQSILDYWVSSKNVRPALFNALLGNSSVSIGKLSELGSKLKGELIDAVLECTRTRGAMPVLQELRKNRSLSGTQAARLDALRAAAAEAETAVVPAPESPAADKPSAEGKAIEPGIAGAPAEENSLPADPETDQLVLAFLTEHAAEIAAEAHKPFQPIGGMYEEEVPAEQAQTAPDQPAVPAVVAVSTGAAAAKPALAAKPAAQKIVRADQQPEKRDSVLQKIAKLDIKGRIQLAMKGSKEERSILVRDGTKLVALAVLDSPKLSDGEVEKFAAQKNVLEAVLRTIPMKRRFVKNYAVVRNLVGNPRTPLDVGLGLMKNLLVADLKNLSGNKEVSETIRKLALRQFQQKSNPGRG